MTADTPMRHFLLFIILLYLSIYKLPQFTAAILCLLYRKFFVSRKLYKTFKNKHDKSCANHKSKDIDYQEYGVGNHIVHDGEHGKGAIVIRADEEHIEGVSDSVGYEIVMYTDVHYHSNSRKDREYHRCLYEILEIHLFSVSECKINTEEYLATVMEHSLCVDEAKMHKYVIGEYVNAQSCEEREGCHKSYSRIVNLLVFNKCHNGKNVQRR